MARIPNGILGEFIIIRSRLTSKPINATPDRLAQQQKIKVCNQFTKPFSGTGFFNKSFPAYGNTGSGYNRVTSSILNLAIKGAYPDIAISYPHVLVSKGPLPVAEDAMASVDEAGNLQFKWRDNSGMGRAKADDKVILVAYFQEKNIAMFSLDAGTREAAKATLQTSIMKGNVAETWMGFLSADEKDAACSVYTGELFL
jgi:hypothetical protein